MIEHIAAHSDYEFESFHQYDDGAYRSARSTIERLRLRVSTFVLFPLRFLLHSRAIAARARFVIVVTSPFYMPLLAATMLGSKTKVIVLMNDIYPEALVARGLIARGNWLERMLKRAFARAFARVAAVVFIADQHRELVFRDMRLPKLVPVIRVSAHSDPFLDSEMEAKDSDLRILYCGTLGLMHDTATFLSWLECFPYRAGVTFSFCTSGASKQAFETRVRAVLAGGRTAADIELGNALSESDWIDAMRHAHVGLVFEDVGSGNVIFPSKVASILAAGQALLAVADVDSPVAKMIVSHDCGWVVAPGDGAAFDRCIHSARNPELLERKRRNAHAIGHAMFGKTAVAQQWIVLLDEVAQCQIA